MGCKFFYGLGSLVFFKTNKIPVIFFQTLETGFLPFVTKVFGESSPWVFQQDGAAIHTRKTRVKQVFEWITIVKLH